MNASGATVDAADPEMVWACAALFDRAGAFDVGHAFARGRLTRSPPALSERALALRVGGGVSARVRVDRHARRDGDERARAGSVGRDARGVGVHSRRAEPVERARADAAPAVDGARGRARDELRERRDGAPRAARLDRARREAARRHCARASPTTRRSRSRRTTRVSGAVRAWLQARPTADFDVWVEQIPFEETRGYIKRVLSSELVVRDALRAGGGEGGARAARAATHAPEAQAVNAP